MTGRVLGHYEILGPLGEGGMGVVYKARDTRLGRLVALKLLSDGASDESRRRRFLQEARTASSLNHPNIVTLHDIGEHEGCSFLAMELVEGKTLDEIIDRKPLPFKKALRYAIQIAEGVARAHSASIIHRDLKPGNVMVTADDTVKVLDFGLAKLIEPEPAPVAETDATRPLRADAARTEAGIILGTVAYMSPSRLKGNRSTHGPTSFRSEQCSTRC